MNKTNAVGLFVDLKSTCLDADEISMLQEPRVAGVILFARNYESPSQLKDLSESIKAQRSDLIISADQEGGRVQRFKQGFTRLPPMLKLFDYYKKDNKDAVNKAQGLGWLMAYELLEQGVDLSFAPVLDVESGCSQVIGDRSFAHEPQAVLDLARGLCLGMREAGMVAVGKHFPGHGGIQADTHLQAATDNRSITELEARDLIPFKQLIAEQKLHGIMPAHVRYPQIDDKNNAGFSNIWLQDILRDKMAFDGVVFSDDLSMQGAANVGGYTQRAKAAINAGCNALLLCNQPAASLQVLQYLKTLSQIEYPLLDLGAWQGQFVANSDKQAQLKKELSLWFEPNN